MMLIKSLRPRHHDEQPAGDERRAASHNLLRAHRMEAEDHRRRANQAERAGVRIVLEHRTEQHFAIDPRRPVAYRLSLYSCSCPDHAVWGRCGHHSLLLSELGMVPGPDEYPWPDEIRPCAQISPER